MDINLKVQSILASVIRIYNLGIRTGSKPKVINEDSILINDGIQEGEVHRGFLWILSAFLYRNQIYSARIHISNETEVVLFISALSQNYRKAKQKGGPFHCVSA